VHHNVSVELNERDALSFNLLRIKGLYMFLSLLAHSLEVLHKRYLVYCVRMSVGYGTVVVKLHCCFFVTALNAFISLAATCRSLTIQIEGIFAFPWQQWLRERSTVLLCTYSAYLVCSQIENGAAVVQLYTSSVRPNKINSMFC
jgi:hypothetical protein